MEAVVRAFVVYGFLLAAFRVAGKRSLGQITTFDFVLLLVIGEATQQALLGDDFSVTNGLVVIASLMSIDLALSRLKGRFEWLGAAIDSRPLLLVEHGHLLEDRAANEGIDESDILAAARELQGLERLDQIEYAVLEQSGGISIIPRRTV
jgi:uncharacterized membrane protein YcaP (DUF421 family)